MKPRVGTISEQKLKSLVASNLKRQHLIGGLPGAQRFLPIAAFAAGDLLARTLGSHTNEVEHLLCGSDNDGQIQLLSPAAQEQSKHFYPSFGMGVAESCLTCSRTQWYQHGFRYTVRPGDVLPMNSAWDQLRKANSGRLAWAVFA